MQCRFTAIFRLSLKRNIFQCILIFFRYLLKALDMYWHEDCLKCGCCDCRLGEVGSTLYTKGNLLLCKRDYLRYLIYLNLYFNLHDSLSFRIPTLQSNTLRPFRNDTLTSFIIFSGPEAKPDHSCCRGKAEVHISIRF